jgi:hypothetical protein
VPRIQRTLDRRATFTDRVVGNQYDSVNESGGTCYSTEASTTNSGTDYLIFARQLASKISGQIARASFGLVSEWKGTSDGSCNVSYRWRVGSASGTWLSLASGYSVQAQVSTSYVASTRHIASGYILNAAGSGFGTYPFTIALFAQSNRDVATDSGPITGRVRSDSFVTVELS